MTERSAGLRKIGDQVYVHGYIDEIRKDTIIIRNAGGYFGTVDGEIVSSTEQQQSLYGYSLEYLIPFAVACRRAGVEEDDLKTFANNCGFAYETMQNEWKRIMDQAVNAMIGSAGYPV